VLPIVRGGLIEEEVGVRVQRRLSTCSLFLVLASGIVLAQEPAVIGYLISVPADEEKADEVSLADEVTCTRGGQALRFEEGMPVFAGDAIETGKGAQVGVAFLDSSVITLRPASRLVVTDYAYPQKREPTHVELTKGRGFFAVNPRPADAHFFVKMPVGEVEVKGTKFEIYASWTGDAYEGRVAVTNGNVTLTWAHAGGLDVKAGEKTLLHMDASVVPELANAQTVDVQKGNMSKAECKLIEACACSCIEVNLGKKNDVKIKSLLKNTDGSKTSTKITEINGHRTYLSSQTKNADKKVVAKTLESGDKRQWYEDNGSSQVSVKLKGDSGTMRIKLFNNFQESPVPTRGKHGRATTSQLYSEVLTFTGTVTKGADGSLHGEGVTKDGDRIVLDERTDAAGTFIRTQSYSLVDPADTSKITTVVFATETSASGVVTQYTTTFDPGATTGTQTIVTTAVDGTKTTTQVAVNATVDGDGHYVVVPGSEQNLGTVVPASPPPPITIVGDTILTQPQRPASP
jgi:hypothetical protein